MPNKDDLITAAPTDSSASLLLEIGTEEIPARFLSLALTMLRDNAEAIFNEYFIGFSDIKTYATPRRLALIIKGIPLSQRERIKEVFGPPKKASFDEKGSATKAAIGFAQSQGIEVSDLVIKKKDKGEYVVAVIQQKGVAVKDLLPEVLKGIILSLSFPKAMRWGSGSLRFVRPIHWMVALFSGDTIQFDIDGIKSGNITKGHRFLSPGSFVVKDISSYVNLLENNFVIVDQEERARRIESGIDNLASSVEGKAVKDAELLRTVTFLVEYPVPVLCTFRSDYLGLPKELLTTVMKDHQKYFAVEDGEGRLKNYFVVISNTKDENSETVKVGAERVIKARFEDAKFYYEEDLRRPLHSRIDDIKRVTFHEKLGSLHDKTKRVVKLASFLVERLCPEKKSRVERAAWLCKTDLLTGVVGEFPELQGLMGKYYAKHDGEEAEVAEAIHEQYLPAHSGDRIPCSDEGSILSLADKIDNIVSFFAAGLIPSGSEDPFALRRQTLAVISILMEKDFAVTLSELIAEARKTLGNTETSLTDNVLRFFDQRFEPLLSAQTYEVDVINSVIHFAPHLPLWEIKERMNALRRFSSERGYSDFLLAVKRIGNIIPDVKVPAPKQKLLSEEQEKILFHNIVNTEPDINALLKDRKYYDSIKILSSLTESINNFFDKVLVMDKREDIRANRLALLGKIWKMASQIADFSKLKENR